MGADGSTIDAVVVRLVTERRILWYRLSIRSRSIVGDAVTIDAVLSDKVGASGVTGLGELGATISTGICETIMGRCQVVVLLLWSMKYGRPNWSIRDSHPVGNGGEALMRGGDGGAVGISTEVRVSIVTVCERGNVIINADSWILKREDGVADREETSSHTSSFPSVPQWQWTRTNRMFLHRRSMVVVRVEGHWWSWFQVMVRLEFGLEWEREKCWLWAEDVLHPLVFQQEVEQEQEQQWQVDFYTWILVVCAILVILVLLIS